MSEGPLSQTESIDIPYPKRKCSISGCSSRAVNPSNNDILCKRHHVRQNSARNRIRIKWQRQNKRRFICNDAIEDTDVVEELEDWSWPPAIDVDLQKALFSNFIEHTGQDAASLWPCCVCARNTLHRKLKLLKECEIPNINLLRPSSTLLASLRHLSDIELNDLWHGEFVLDQRSIKHVQEHHPTARPDEVALCEDCHSALSKHEPHVPTESLANGLWTGDIPDVLANLTEAEKLIIALRRPGNRVYKLKGIGSGDMRQNGSHGHWIMFDQDVGKLERILPRDSIHLSQIVTVCVVGPHLTENDIRYSLRNVLTVSPVRIRAALAWLTRNNSLYRSVTISDEAIAQYNGSVPDSISFLRGPDAEDDDETRHSSHASFNFSLDDPQADCGDSADTDGLPIVDACGFLPQDQSMTMSDDEMRQQALRSFLADSGVATDKNFFEYPRGSSMVSEIDNPDLLPSVYPTLYPYGVGGVPTRASISHVSLDGESGSPRVPSLVAYFRSLLNRFQSPWSTNESFPFVALNMLQRKEANLQSYLQMRLPGFESFATKANSVTLKEMEDILNEMKLYGRLSPTADKRLLEISKRLHVVGSNVTGSPFARDQHRNFVKAQTAAFGPPQLFVTVNPADIHHPIACHYAGATFDLDNFTVDMLPSPAERVRMIARNPVAAAKFFKTIMDATIKCLILGLDERTGGIFGPVKSYFGTIEAQGRGTLHCHMLIWLKGAPPPDEIANRLRSAPTGDWSSRLYEWLDQTIHEDFRSEQYINSMTAYDNSQYDAQGPNTRSKVNPASQPTLKPDLFPTAVAFVEALKQDAERVGRSCLMHSCTPSCHKYCKNSTKKECRYGYPKPLVENTTFDSDTEKVNLRRHEHLINNHNMLLTSALRCNNDVQFLGSGDHALCAMYYITKYITKKELDTHNLHTFIATAKSAEQLYNLDTESSDCLQEAKRLLVRCLNKVASKQEYSAPHACYLLLYGDDIFCNENFEYIPLSTFLGYAAHLQSTTDSNSDQMQIEQPPFTEDDIDGTNILALSPDGSRSGFTATSKVLDYILRPQSLDISIYDYVAFYKKTRIPKHMTQNRLLRFHENHPQHHTHYLSCFNSQCIPVLSGPSVPGQDSADADVQLKYAKYALLLTKPWRKLEDLRSPSDAMWTSAWASWESSELMSPSSKAFLRNVQYLHRSLDIVKLDQQKRSTAASKALAVFSTFGLHGGPDFDDDKDPLFNSDEIQDFGVSLFEDPHAESDVTLTDIENNSYNSDFFTLKGVISLADAACFDVPSANIPVPPQHVSASSQDATSPLNPDTIRTWHRLLSRYQPDSSTSDSLFPNAANPTVPDRSDDSLDPSLLTMSDFLNRLHFPSNDVHGQADPATIPTGAAQILSLPQLRLLTCLSAEFVDWWGHKFNLNEKQTVILRMIAATMREANELPSIPALPSAGTRRLLITGAAGSGKTHIILAIKSLFEICGISDRIIFLAPTGTAASNINGSTVHSGLGISVRNTKSSLSLSESMNPLSGGISHDRPRSSIPFTPGQSDGARKLTPCLDKLKFVLIDEVSMVGQELMEKVHNKLCSITRNDKVSFGGINMIFAGDFYQLSPVGDKGLWEDPAKSKNLSEITGRSLWLSLTHCVQLTQIHRQDSSQENFKALLQRLRDGSCTHDDYHVLKSRIIGTNNLNFKTNPNWYKAKVLVTRNELRHHINLRSALRFAHQTGQPLVLSPAVDSHTKRSIPSNLRKQLLKHAVSAADHEGLIPLVTGLPIQLKDNMSVPLGLTNGSDGIIRSFHFHGQDAQPGQIVLLDRPPNYIIVEFQDMPSNSPVFPGLPPKHVPLVPTKKSFEVKEKLPPLGCRRSRTKSTTYNRLQFPISLSFALTDYKCQGKSLQSAIADLRPPPGFPDPCSPYVMCSRVKTLEGLAVLCEFPLKSIQRPKDAALIKELQRLHVLETQSLLTVEPQLTVADFRPTEPMEMD